MVKVTVGVPLIPPVAVSNVNPFGNVLGLMDQVNVGYPPLPESVLAGVNVVATFLDKTFGEACVGLVEVIASAAGVTTVRLNDLL